MNMPENIENKTIAIVMTDIIGSTKFVQKNGAQKAAIWFSMHDRLTMSLIYENGGVFIDASDGMLCYFYSVKNAIEFAFKYKKKLIDKKFPFRSRIGIHWDDMIITKTNQKLVKGGAKRLNIEGIGKNICARTMSLCGKDQILLSHNAYISFKSRTYSNNNIPKNSLICLVGLYQFKGVNEPEQIYAIGTQESHLQPPQDSEKAKRIGGKNKIKVRLKHKKIKEIFEYFFWRIGLIVLFYMIYQLWPILRYFEKLNEIHYMLIYISEKLNEIFELLAKYKVK